ncbi:phosphoribosylformylglycinamidine synthase subunit PurQ [Parapedobacter sp. ISTM3]|uniref:Phosphoribosylformylglycinamidine synthase subunit PurQ n=1 Tax=Parapedobacter luteus TaxID=623280 RepID=A0A1T5DMU2_9SPHI|nr:MULTISPECIES: phosphoribosylformylglycinamidine synthase subunit PurQ [Parapedobacter]MBK1440928.1 phosphoribosylformylglycinamidine synthase subunit PurQ [Parapedobacter sp. ISTM3]SKB73017.1 phosphoribosylformylglycinamidine synthase [Parapedobacter luteus]
MKFGVVIFPGSNCDEDIIYVLEHIMGQEVVRLWHKDHDLQGAEFIVLPGGFSYGDYLRSGAIARFSPIMQEIIAYANKGGYLLGICNGFQILAEAGLVPGALLHNKQRKFICENVYLKAQTSNSLITAQLDLDRAYKIPVAHGEGNYFVDTDTLKSLNDNDQVLFRYCDAAGNITEAANPNGSIANIAGVCNRARNVFGMMPHPERAADCVLGNEDGLGIFESILHTALS